MIPPWKISKLTKLGEDFRCVFNLPPFDGNMSEAFFDIEEFRNTDEFQDFLIHIKSLEVPFEYGKLNSRICLVIKVKNQ